MATEATATVTALQQDGVTPLVLSAAQQLAIENAFTITNVAGNTNDGTVTWDYTILETALDFLGEGEQVTAVFTVTVTDDQLAIATQNVTITITGANDAPLIVAGDVTGNITEGTTLTDNGSMTFTDVDLTDRPVATEATATVTALQQDGVTPLVLSAAQQLAIENAFTITNVAGNTNDGTVTWDYTILETALDFLGEGEQVTAVFTVTVTDDQLAIATQNVTITITGANDAPLIVAGDVTGNITEGTTLTDNGSMTFTDVDLTDRPVATEATATVTALQQDGVTPLVLSAAQQLAIENAFTITNVAGNTNDGTVTWDYTILETALDFLGEGEQVTAVFHRDGHR